MTVTTTAAATTSRQAVLESSIGELTLVRDDDGLTGLYFPGHWTNPDRSAFGPVIAVIDDADLATAARQLEEYLAAERQDFDLRLHPVGSDLARQVWALLAEIPYGETTTYGELARQVGRGISARAIGGLVGRNPLSILIPCHRVVGATGKLTGYAGGLERKQLLLELEGALPAVATTLW
jgi:methylated-DNA-[protein]-cysteine S-methyltransferase